MAKTTTLHLRVELEQPDSDDTTEYIIKTDNRDRVQWDILRARKGWPALEQGGAGASLWSAVLAWNALRRSGVTVGTIEQFLERAVTVQACDENGEPVTAATAGGDAVDPTQPGADTDS